MTRIFVYEYLCAQRAGGDDPTARSLLAEGHAMREAIAEDLRQAGAEVIPFGPDDYVHEERISFQRRAATANLSLIIAPEFDGILETRCRWVVEAGGHLLGPSPAAVRLTADKLTLGRYLSTAGIATPRTWAPPEHTEKPFPQVWKPRHGAGSVATMRLNSAEDVPTARGMLEDWKWHGELIGQEWVEGHPASVSFLLGKVVQVALTPASQEIAPGMALKYLGGRVPIPEPWARRAIDVAKQAIRSIPGLLGYVSVDVVLGPRDWVIEINPRLTTSYIGLRQLCETNLAAALLAIATGGPTPELRWKPGVVHFRAEGAVSGSAL